MHASGSLIATPFDVALFFLALTSTVASSPGKMMESGVRKLVFASLLSQVNNCLNKNLTNGLPKKKVFSSFPYYASPQ